MHQWRINLTVRWLAYARTRLWPERGTNTLTRRDLQIPSVKEEISRYSSHYSARLTAHPNDILLTLLEPPERKSLYFVVCTLFSPTATQGFHPFITEGCYRALLYPPSLPDTPFAECIRIYLYRLQINWDKPKKKLGIYSLLRNGLMYQLKMGTSHMNEINKPLLNNGHLPNITHVGGSHIYIK
jgi:hypothetical protein